MTRVLIVDDEGNIRRMLSSLLAAEGYSAQEAASGEEALERMRAAEPDAVMLDLALPGQSGLDVITTISHTWPEIPVVMMSGQATLADAVEATRRGVHQFLEKPLTPEAVLVTLRSALELKRQRELNRALRQELQAGQELVGECAAIQAVRDLIRTIAASDSRVLITGESGTGKELVAAAIHDLSERRAGPFVRINCAAIPKDLIESELFGHEKGAFTGATQKRRGKFELADGGTLLLDEVGDLSPEAQAKLLRAIEAGEIERVGGGEPISVDVRVIAATNRDIEAEVRDGSFREDLFFRLHVMPIRVPPLRERGSDIALLVAHFVELYGTRHGRVAPTLNASALTALAGYEWPGNVRELANTVERLTILYPGQQVGAEEIVATFPNLAHEARPTSEGALTEMLDSYERRLIQNALAGAGGNVAEAARRLATDRPNLYRRMKRLGIRRGN